MWTQSWLLLLSLGIGISQARPAADPAATSPGKPIFTHKPQSCFTIGCTVEQTPVWDETLGKCVCKWTLDPYPDYCKDMLCIAEKQVTYDAKTRTCGCTWIPGFGPTAIPNLNKEVVREVAATPSFAPCAIRCRVGWHAEQNKFTGQCSCKIDNCPNMVCISEMKPVYNATSDRCMCQWIEGFGPPVIYWPPPKTTSSLLSSITPAPSYYASLSAREPKATSVICAIGCPSGYHVDASAGGCRCVSDNNCSGLYCISEQHPVYDPALGRCACVWYSIFAPTSTLKPRTSSGITKSIVVPTTRPSITPCNIRCASGFHLENDPITGKCKCVSDLCPDIICNSEQNAVYDKTTQKCSCQWIPGWPGVGDPTTLAVRSPTKPKPTRSCLLEIVCIAEMRPVYIPGSKECTCEWIPGLEPGEPITIVTPRAAEPSINPVACRCALGYHTIWDKWGRCSCVKDAEPLPCAIRCAPGYHLETSLDTGECSCERDVKPLPCGVKCKEGYHLETSFETGKCSCVLDSVEIGQEELCLKYTACLIGHPFWDADKQICTCTSDDAPLEPAVEARATISCCAATLCGPRTQPVCYGRQCRCEPTPDWEQICLIATSCVTGSHPVWNSSKKKCTCEANEDPEKICLIATTCLVGTVPVWDSEAKTCSCEASEETLCRTATECFPGSVPVWNSYLQVCQCVKA